LRLGWKILFPIQECRSLVEQRASQFTRFFQISIASPWRASYIPRPVLQDGSGFSLGKIEPGSYGKTREAFEMKARLYDKYVKEVVPALKEKRKYANPHQIPRMEKIVVNMGVSASLEKSAIDDASKDLALITGRKPAVSKSRHSIANFKLREGQPIGCRVTLRRDAMYEFFDRLVATALPRIRDFRGLSTRSFDGRGNYSVGINDQTIFPEIELDKIKRTQGMDITIVTSARSNDEAMDLLKMMGMPFAENR
jgi:large subunit ribosomal protein L5